MDNFRAEEDAAKWATLFPRISNQEINRSLKLIGEICEIKKRLTVYLARAYFRYYCHPVEWGAYRNYKQAVRAYEIEHDYDLYACDAIKGKA